MRRLRITSDGTAAGTCIMDADTGAVLPNVIGITWSVNSGELSIATVTLDLVEVEVIGEAREPLHCAGPVATRVIDGVEWRCCSCGAVRVPA